MNLPQGDKNMNFTDSVKRQHITKSLTLELIPTKETFNTIKKQNLMQINDKHREMADSIKPAYDEWIKSVLDKSLASFSYDFNSIDEIVNNAAKNGLDVNSAYKEEIKNIKESLKKHIAEVIKAEGVNKLEDIRSANFLKTILPAWIEKQSSKDMPFDINLMLNNLKEAEGLTGFLTKFVTSRITAISVWAVDRVIENYEIYKKNIPVISAMLNSEYCGEITTNYPEIKDFIYPSYYSNVLTSKGIAFYNKVISGEVKENKIVTKGFNILANEIAQSSSGKSVKIRKMVSLNKQILFPVDKTFTIDRISTDDEAKEIIESSIVNFTDYSKLRLNFISENIKNAIILGTDLRKLSYICKGDYTYLPNFFYEIKMEEYKNILSNTSDKKTIKAIKNKIDTIGKDINKEQYAIKEIETLTGLDISSILLSKIDYCWEKISACLKDIETIKNKPLFGNENSKIIIINYFNAITSLSDITRIIKRGLASDKTDPAFEIRFSKDIEFLAKANKGLNLLRNYLVRSNKDICDKNLTYFGNLPLSNDTWFDHTNKSGMKVSFNNKLLLKNKEGEYFIAFRTPFSQPFSLVETKNKDYYDVFSKSSVVAQGAAKIIPKSLFSKSTKRTIEEENSLKVELSKESIKSGSAVVTKDVLITDIVDEPMTLTSEFINIYMKELHKKSNAKKYNISEEELRANEKIVIATYIEFFKKSKTFGKYNINFGSIDDYNSLNELCNYIDANAMLNEWVRVDALHVNSLVKEGSLLMFKVYSRYLYGDKHKGYGKVFLDIFSNENMKDLSLRICAKSSITYRPAIVKNPIIHKKGSFLVNKKDVNGNFIPASIYAEIYKYYNNKMEAEPLSEIAKNYITNNLVVYRKAEKDIVKDNRYTTDKFFITLTYDMNCSLEKENVSTITEEFLNKAIEGNRLAVIRNTEHLIYCTVVDKNNNIIYEKDLDVINGINYKTKLHILSNERKKDKSDKWEYDKCIKNIRTAYLDFAITEIIKLSLKYNAVIAIEKISDRVKDRMSMIDDQLYKTFETRLENRLKCITFNTSEGKEPGSNMNPIQLVRAKTFNSKALCNGILIKNIPTKTTVMDPSNGFVNIFKLDNISRISEKEQFISKFKSIIYSDEKNGYICEFDYNDFLTYVITKKTKWTLLAGGKRSKYDKELKRTIIIPNIADAMHIWAKENNIEDNVNLAELAFNNKLPNEGIKLLYDLITETLYNLNYKEQDKDTLYVSPIIDGSRYEFTKSHVSAVNLLNKNLMFLKTRNEIFDASKDYTKEWLDYAQNK